MRGCSFWALSLASFLVAGCGGTGGNRETIGHEQDFTEVAAPQPSVAQYSTGIEAGNVVRGPGPSAAVERGVATAAEAHEMPVSGDPRLAQLASWIVDRLGPDGEPPPNEVVEFFARTLGLVEPVPHIMVLGVPPDRLEAGITSSVGQFMDRQTYNRWGAALTEDRGLTIAVVMLSWRWVELEPVPRAVAASTSIALRGELATGFRNPSVVVALPSGAVRRMPAGAGPGFDVQVTTEETGAHQVEVIGRGPRGDTVIANFPVYVGVEVPSVVRVGAEQSEGGRDVESVRDELLALLNQSREQAGLAPLLAHAGLRDVGLAHSRDMASNGFIGHRSPSTGTAADRVRGASLNTGLVLENIGRGYSAQEIHRGLMESPGHRANLINPDVSHVGIGVVAEPENDRSAFIVTQVFIRMAEEVNLDGAAARLAEQINRSRSARGAPSVELEEHLSEAAQQAAEAFFEDPSLSQQDTVDDATASLRRFAIAYRRMGGVMAVVADPAEAAALEPTLEAGIRAVGIGVAQGTRADTGPNAIAVVIVIAWPR